MEGATGGQQDEAQDGDGEPERGPSDLDAPADDGDLYETYGADEDDPLRPVFQGDVYTGITLQGYEPADHQAVMLVGHPCTMRKGAELRDRLQAVAVCDHHRVPARKWPTSEKRCFLLPALDGGKCRRADLSEIGVVTRGQLEHALRFATLSQKGIFLLQQRIVWSFAGTVVRLDTLKEYNTTQMTELELLGDWNEQLCGECSAEERNAALGATAREFEEYMIESGLRELLDRRDGHSRTDADESARRETDPVAHVRMEARREAERRKAARGAA